MIPTVCRPFEVASCVADLLLGRTARGVDEPRARDPDLDGAADLDSKRGVVGADLP